MSKSLLIEYALFTPKSVLTEGKGDRNLMVEGVIQRADAKNQNGRVYPKSILEREVERYIDGPVSENRALGELDHPESMVINLKNVSHNIKQLWWNGDDLMGKVELLNTPSGNIVKEILRGGHTIGISSRGTGSVQQTNEGTLMVQPDFELVCWDFVSNPSTQGAFMNQISLNEGKKVAGKYDRLDSIINNILRA